MVINNDYKNIAIAALQSKPAKPVGKERTPKGDEPNPAEAGRKKIALKETKKVAETISKLEQYMNRGIRLDIDNDLNIVVVKIVDKDSGDVIKQIPPADSIEISKGIKEQISKNNKSQSGLLIDKEI